LNDAPLPGIAAVVVDRRQRHSTASHRRTKTTTLLAACFLLLLGWTRALLRQRTLAPTRVRRSPH
jgi:hypothetical protein